MQLDLHEGDRLFSAQGDDLGTLRQFVIDPSTAQVTHVLVEKGIFFPDDRVVPVETIAKTEGGEAYLSEMVDPQALPRFVREDYTELDEATSTRLSVPIGGYYMWRFPTAHAGPFPMYPAYPMPSTRPIEPEVDDPKILHELAGSEVIDARTPVRSMSGEKVGTVSEIEVDGEGRITHLVVDLGFLSDEKLLPAHWIESIESDAVHLAVGDEALATLETIT